MNTCEFFAKNTPLATLEAVLSRFYEDISELTSVLGSPTPVLGKGGRGEGRNLVILEDKRMNNRINEKVSSRALH